MVLHDSYGRDARHEARRATGHVLVKSLNRARHPTVLVGWIRLFCLKCPKNPTVLVGWEMSEIFSGMNQKTSRGRQRARRVSAPDLRTSLCGAPQA